MLASPLLTHAGFDHVFTLRDVGADAVAVARHLGIAPGDLYQVRQVHGARVVRAVGAAPSLEVADEADAVIAAGDGRAAGVRVADCVPILVGDPATGAVAAIHAGWRGLVAGVLECAVTELSSTPGSARRGLLAAVGPHIGSCCFEVGDEVATAMGSTEDVVLWGRGPKPFVDLGRAVHRALLGAGLGEAHIDHVEGCTRCDAARFYSYRRDQTQAGRHLAAIRSRRPRET